LSRGHHLLSGRRPLLVEGDVKPDERINMRGECLGWRQRALLWSIAWFVAVFVLVLSLIGRAG
jgi:hypothetical protein